MNRRFTMSRSATARAKQPSDISCEATRFGAMFFAMVIAPPPLSILARRPLALVPVNFRPRHIEIGSRS